MQQSAVHEHGSEEGEKNRNGSDAQTGQEHPLARVGIDQDLRMRNDIAARNDLPGHRGIGIGEPGIMSPSLPVNKYKDVKRYEQVIDNGRCLSVPIVISNG